MLLAIETSSRIGSIALCDGPALLEQRTFSHGLQNAARVLPLIDEMCRQHSIMPRDITAVAVSIGPGSFTGLRIGVTLAKTLAFATGAKLIAVPTLPVIASNAPSDVQWVMPILDAKRDQVYAALYQRTGHALDEVQPPQLAHLPDLLARSPRPLFILGEGVKYHQQHLPGDGDPGLQIAPEELWWPGALTVAHLAMRLHEQGAFADPFKLTPLYIRKPEAQERMEAGLLKHLE
jgi:tRNA threonylcarbamoyladenosine biosynthesis protein TsaB